MQRRTYQMFQGKSPRLNKRLLKRRDCFYAGERRRCRACAVSYQATDRAYIYGPLSRALLSLASVRAVFTTLIQFLPRAALSMDSMRTEAGRHILFLIFGKCVSSCNIEI
ncbi:hypothetical protein V5799_002808 [Amblyomma americanum]|uniref:Uncharacterized protein n=1 Tax=Amblyomma americanum TaxID=6943 RepID=A0AAQ4DAS2_AMBAM